MVRALRPLWLAVALALGPPGAGADVLVLDPAQAQVPLGPAAEAWLDATGQASVEQIAGEPRLVWTPERPDEIHRIAPGQALWLRFTVAAAAPGARWYLEVPHPSVDRVTLHAPGSDGGWRRLQAGDALPVADWPVPYRYPMLPLALPAEGTRTFYLKVENRHSFGAPLSLVSEAHFSAAGQRSALLLGMYFGLALLAVALSLLGAVAFRDKTHALYALAVATMALTQAALTGVAGQHLWRHWPAWNDRGALLLPVLTVGAIHGFLSVALSVRERSRSLYRLENAFGLAALPAAAAILAIADPQWRYVVLAVYTIAGTVFGLFVLLWAMRRGDAHAPWLFAGLLPVALGSAFPIARSAGLWPTNMLALHAMQIAIALELPLLLVVLMLRSRRRHEPRRRMQGVDRLDPATGLLNGVVFHERLERLIARSQRLRMRSAVLLVDIVNLEAIHRQFGRELARELPLRVAGRLLSAARGIDSVARLSEHRFGLLIEGPLDEQDVAQAAPRIVTRCLMPYHRRPLHWAPQVRVAQALVPADGRQAGLLLRRLDGLLASGARSGAGAVLLLPDAPLTWRAAATS